MTTFLFSFIILLTGCSNIRTHKEANRNIIETSNNAKQDSTYLSTGWYYVIDIDNGFKRQLDKSNDTYFLDAKAIVTTKNFKALEIYESNAGEKKYLGLAIYLDKEGTEKWSFATNRSIGKQLSFVLDNKLLQVAKVNSEITSGATALNRGDYSRKELEKFKAIIEGER